MKILVHSSEAGFSTYIETVLLELQKEGHQIQLELHEKAKNYFKSISQDQFDDPDLVLTGFDDVRIDLTSNFLQRYSDKPSIGFLDSWRGIDRFWKNNGETRELSNFLLVPNSLCLEYLINRGLPKEKLQVIGHPLVEHFRTLKQRKRDLLRSAPLPANYNSKLPNLVFFSEPLRLPKGERQSLTTALTKDGPELLEYIFTKYHESFNLFLKLHPIEQAPAAQGWTNIENLSLEQALALSDKTIGLASTVMSYSKWAGIETIYTSDLLLDWQPAYSDIPKLLWQKIEEHELLISRNTIEKDKNSGSSQFALKKLLHLIKSSVR